jgi:hypothetical protein
MTEGLFCHIGDLIDVQLVSADYQQPLTNVTFGHGDKYACENMHIFSPTHFSCTLPPVDWRDWTKKLPVRAHAGGKLSVPFMGVAVYNHLTITGAYGCSGADYWNGSQPWRADECEAGKRLAIRGTGFGEKDVKMTVGGVDCPYQWPPGNVTLYCTLPKLPTHDKFYNVTVTWSGKVASMEAVVRYAGGYTRHRDPTSQLTTSPPHSTANTAPLAHLPPVHLLVEYRVVLSPLVPCVKTA